jgi:hypothetical protein
LIGTATTATTVSTTLGAGVSISGSVKDITGSSGTNGQVLAVTASGLAYTTIAAATSVAFATSVVLLLLL